MLKNVAIAIALTLVPVAASAQEHKHGDSTSKTKHTHAATATHGEHVNFAQLVMQKRAELKLTDEQIAKLEDMSAKMQQHHSQAGKPDAAQPTEADHAKMHESLMSIFTEEQTVKVRELMKQHKEQCSMGDNKQCKMGSTGKKELQ